MAEEKKESGQKLEAAEAETEEVIKPEQAEEKPKNSNASDGNSKLHRLKHWYGTHKKFSIPLTILILALVLAAIPFSRYAIAGTFMKKDVSFYVISEKSKAKLSGAAVTVDGNRGTAESYPYQFKNLAVGTHKLKVTADNHETVEKTVTVGIGKAKTQNIEVKMVATGRSAYINVKNVINNQLVKTVSIKYKNYEATSDKDGVVYLVVGPNDTSVEVEISAEGYNSAKQKINTSENALSKDAQTVTLAPTGKIYFLSKQSGKIDVVKTNLDGTDRKTVLAGTGREEDRGTVLLASQDWKYLALLSRRDSDKPKLYVIDTSTDRLNTIDEGNATFGLVGWSDHNFVYTVNRNGVASWQKRGQALKSYTAGSGQLITLDQTAGEGTGPSDYFSEEYAGVYLIDKNVIYEKIWNYYSLSNPTNINSKHAGIYSIGVTGANASTLKTFDYAYGEYTSISSIPYETKGIYYQVTDNGADKNYAYENGKVTSKSNLSDEFDKYYQSSTTYLISPNNRETFWSESRDGKDTFFVGDDGGENGKQVAVLNEFNQYGWFTDDYLLVSKKGSELYIMPKSGLKEGSLPLKVTDYHKPNVSYPAYGGGYGGI